MINFFKLKLQMIMIDFTAIIAKKEGGRDKNSLEWATHINIYTY